MHAVPHLVLRVLVLYLCTRTHVHRTRAKFNAFARSPHMVIDKFKLIMHHSAQAMDVDTQPLFPPQSHEHTDYTKTQSDGDKLQPFWSSQADDAYVADRGTPCLTALSPHRHDQMIRMAEEWIKKTQFPTHETVRWAEQFLEDTCGDFDLAYRLMARHLCPALSVNGSADEADEYMKECDIRKPLGKKPANDAYVEEYLRPPAKMARTQAPRQALVGWMNIKNINQQWGDELANSIITNPLTLPRRWNHNAEEEYLITNETVCLYYQTNPALHQTTMPKIPCVPSACHMTISPPPSTKEQCGNPAM